jgi:D-sedoheptulose 7-phosphate isomerase
MAGARSRESAGLSARLDAGPRFFDAEAERIARLCHAMAQRFAGGGRLIAVGETPAARSDARHVAVEFVHPVIVGKRALPAMSLATDTATLTGISLKDGFEDVFAAQLRLHGQPADIALGLSADARSLNVLRALDVAHQIGMLTVAMVGTRTGPIAASPAVDHLLVADSDDPLIVKEVHVTTYHILWELVHVFFEQAALPGAAARR